MGAQAEALVQAMVALLPVLFGAWLLHAMGASKEFVLTSFLGVMVWVMVRAYVKEIRASEKAWRLSEWVDFERRTWNARKSFLDGALPDRIASVPLDDLALVCFVHQWEHSDSYDVGLCKLTDLNSLGRGEPAILNVIQSNDKEEEARFRTRIGGAMGHQLLGLSV